MKVRYIKIFLSSIILSCIVFVLFPWTVLAGPESVVDRIWGDDRYQTSAAISRRQCVSSEYVVLSTGEGDDKFADALAGAPLAYLRRAPVLLTETGSLNANTRNEIRGLGASKAIILGGTGVVSDNVKSQLEAMGITVTRLWGMDRYETAVKIAEKIRTERVFTKIFLTTGEQFQYAMMAAPFSARYTWPILFTETDRLTEATRRAIRDWGISEVEIVGGTDVVSNAVFEQLRGMGVAVSRAGGSTVQECNISIIRRYSTPTHKIALARDDVFADALSGAPFVALNDALLLLIGSNSVHPAIQSFISGMTVETAYVFGGPGAVSDSVLDTLFTPGSRISGNGTSPGNIGNYGFAAVQGDWVYFTNFRDMQKLYKSKLNGTELTKLNDFQSFYINVSGNWVYYSNGEMGGRMYKVKTDGTGSTMLTEERASGLIVEGDWIYYSGESGLCRIRTDGTGREEIRRCVALFINVVDDWVYYIDSREGYFMHKIKSDGSGLQTIGSNHAYGMVYNDGYLYYSRLYEGNGIYSVNVGAPDASIPIASLRTRYINVDDGWVYFDNIDDGSKLYKMRFDGSGFQRLNDESASYIQVIGEWIYYTNVENVMCRIKKDGTGRQTIP